MRRVLIAVLLSFAVAALLIAAVAAVGSLTRDRLRQQQARTIRLVDIDFNPPPDQDRDLFLAELQYDRHLPDELNLDDRDVLPRLRSAFLQHPRVESLEPIRIDGGNHVHVKVVYRLPVLGVAVADSVRVVDRKGVLLPPSVSATGLPVLRGTPLPPLVESGTIWADSSMIGAVRTAAVLQPYQAELQLAEITVHDDGEIVLRTSMGSEIHWGHAPGLETKTEPNADEKLRKLRAHADLDLRSFH